MFILHIVICCVFFLSREISFVILVTLFFVFGFKRRDFTDDLGEPFFQILKAADCVVRDSIGTIDFFVDVVEVRLGRKLGVLFLSLRSLCRI